MYLVLDGMAIRMSEHVRASDASMQKILAAIFASRLVNRLKKTTMQIYVELLREVAAKCGKSILAKELRLTFVKSGYMMREYILTMTDAVLE